MEQHSETNASPIAIDSRDWVDLRTFAEIVGKSYPTVIKMRKAKKFIAVKVGGTYRVYADEVRRYLREGNLNDDPYTKE